MKGEIHEERGPGPTDEQWLLLSLQPSTYASPSRSLPPSSLPPTNLPLALSFLVFPQSLNQVLGRVVRHAPKGPKTRDDDPGPVWFEGGREGGREGGVMMMGSCEGQGGRGGVVYYLFRPGSFAAVAAISLLIDANTVLVRVEWLCKCQCA